MYYTIQLIDVTEVEQSLQNGMSLAFCIERPFPRGGPFFWMYLLSIFDTKMYSGRSTMEKTLFPFHHHVMHTKSKTAVEKYFFGNDS